MIISNSTPLILLSKINKLAILQKLYKKINIPNEVYYEVIVKGKKENYSQAAEIERHINEFIFVKNINAEFKKEADKLKNLIGSGEGEAIALCLQEKADLLLTDDLEARKFAQIKGIKYRGTLGIMLEALKSKIITLSDYMDSIKELSKLGWLSGDIVAYFLEEGYKFKGDKK